MKATDITLEVIDLEKLVDIERRVINIETILASDEINKAQTNQIEDLRREVQNLWNYVRSLPTREYIETYMQNYNNSPQAITGNSSIFGYRVLNIDRILQLFQRNNHNYTEYDIRKILTYYDNHAKIVDIDPYIIVAQMAKESDWLRSWWSARPRRNPVGYGVNEKTMNKEPKNTETEHWVYNNGNDKWQAGFSFATWEEAVKVHIGHILKYFEHDQMTDKQKEYITLSPRAKLVKVKANKLSDLDGRWNRDKNTAYGASIAKIAQTLKEL